MREMTEIDVRIGIFCCSEPCISRPFLSPSQIAQRNAYFQTLEREPDNVCPFQRVPGYARAMICSTCRSFVIPQSRRDQANAPWHHSALSPSQPSLASTETFPLPGDSQFLMDQPTNTITTHRHTHTHTETC